MSVVKIAIEQPITVSVCILLALVAGVVAILRVPVQMTPTVDDTVIAVSTNWENASPQEIETEVVDKQEEKLQGIANLRNMTSTSRNGQGQIRLEFETGINKEVALREVSDKLREVSDYPLQVKEPVIEASDPESNDYIAWCLLRTPDERIDMQTLSDFVEDRVKPHLERVAGMSEVNIFGGRERELQVHFDPVLLAQHQLSITAFVAALQDINKNLSAGALQQGKYDVRIRTVSRFTSPESILNAVIRKDEAGPVFVRDVATVHETFKEERSFVRHKGQKVLAMNFQREPGSNLLSVMAGLKEELKRINKVDGVLDTYAKAQGIEGGLEIIQVYDQSNYVEQAFGLVQGNIIFGGLLAVIILMIFLRSLRSIGIIAVAIPVSIVGTIVVMVSLGRSINVISLAGMAFAVGMVVDNSIVVLENIFRHMEMGKNKVRAALDGTMEVRGAVLASTLTTMLVFIPILLIQEMSGQLLRDISLAIVTSVGLSFIISITVIPSGAALFLRAKTKPNSEDNTAVAAGGKFDPLALFKGLPLALRKLSYWLNGGFLRRIVLVLVFAIVTILGIVLTLPPIDYLPTGNRNLTFGLMIPPPGYSVQQMKDMGDRVEERVRPFWTDENGQPDKENMYQVPGGFFPGAPMVTPPGLEHYFLVGSEQGMLFHGGVSIDDKRVADVAPLFQMATSQAVLPGTFGFAFQFPLFRLGGSSGGAVKIDLVGSDLELVKQSAGALMGTLFQEYGPYATRPDPANFSVPTPEVQIKPNLLKLTDINMPVSEFGLAVQANSDGIIVGDYEWNNDIVDMKVVSKGSQVDKDLNTLDDALIATPDGSVLSIGSLSDFNVTNAPEQIKRVNRQRAVTLEFTPPAGMPLQAAIDALNEKITAMKQQGVIHPDVSVFLAGSASRLTEVKEALLGDGSFIGLTTSALFLALVVVYLLMCVLFQSWLYPMVIMVSVPLATLGGFLGLAVINLWSNLDRYMPVQNMDVLTILGLVILAGVVVNNAILIVAQTINFTNDPEYGDISYREAIALAVESRVRPIFISTLTSVGGMLPLVLMPGSGSELYRGLGAVVLGGLIVSTIFTLVLVPALLGLVHDIRERIRFGGKMKNAAALLLGVCLLQSCAVGKDYQRPDMQHQATWQHSDQQAQEHIDLSQWWQHFDDSELNELVDLALSGNYDIHIAKSRVLEARAKRGLAKSALWPSIDLIGSYTRQRSSENVDSGFKNGALAGDVETEAIDVFSTGFDAQWELDLFGGLGRNAEAAAAELAAVEMEMHQVCISMLAELAINYMEYRDVQNRLAITQANIRSQEQTLTMVRARHEAGLSSQLDLAQAQTNLSRTKVHLPGLQEERAHALHRIAILTAQQPHLIAERLQAVKPMPLAPSAIYVGIPADTLRQRPDIKVAERQLAMQTAMIGVIESELYPKFFANGSFNVSASEVGDLFESGSINFGLGPAFRWNIFAAGRIKNQVAAQEEREQQALLHFHKTVLNAILEVEGAIISHAHEKERVAALADANKHAEHALAIAKEQYERGIIEFESVLQSERTVFELQSELAHGQATLLTNIVALYKSLGGGWSAKPSNEQAAENSLVD